MLCLQSERLCVSYVRVVSSLSLLRPPPRVCFGSGGVEPFLVCLYVVAGNRGGWLLVLPTEEGRPGNFFESFRRTAGGYVCASLCFFFFFYWKMNEAI